MRRFLGVLMAAVVAMSIVPPARAALPGAGGGAEQAATAMWHRMHGDTGVLYAADGLRIVGEGVPITLGGVAKGKCTRTRAKRWVLIFCSASGVMKEIGTEQLQIDPLLRTASMTLDQGGQTHTVDWAARGVPSHGQWAGAGGWGAEIGAGRGVWAPAQGTVFGREVAKGCEFCVLSEGAGAAVYSDLRHSLEVTREGHRFSVSLEIRRRA